MESIEKLREFVGKELYEKERIGHGDYSHLHVLIEDVKREIAECYMKLPVDADGVPIHVGDKLETAHGGKVIVEYVGECEVRVYRDGEHYRITQDEYAYTYRHVGQDTIESLLEDVSKGAIGYPRERVAGYLEDNHPIGEAVLLDVRDRLRKIMQEVDE